MQNRSSEWKREELTEKRILVEVAPRAISQKMQWSVESRSSMACLSDFDFRAREAPKQKLISSLTDSIGGERGGTSRTTNLLRKQLDILRNLSRIEIFVNSSPSLRFVHSLLCVRGIWGSCTIWSKQALWDFCEYTWQYGHDLNERNRVGLIKAQINRRNLCIHRMQAAEKKITF